MDKLRRRLSFNLAALAVLGSFLLGMGQQDYRLPLLTLLVAVVSLQLTDLRGLFQLNRTVANLAALVAVALSAYDFTRLQREDQLLAIANLLVYLQVVVFFQKKTPRIHWQLAMLSLLQVVVAAALNYSLLFGVLLVCYMCLGIYAMAQIFIYRESLAFDLRGEGESNPTESPLARSARLVELSNASRLWRITTKVGLTTLLVTLLIFFTIPRFGRSALRGLGSSQRRMVGYSQNVELGELGQIVENPQTVLQLQLFENDSNVPIRLAGEPFLRGSLLATYRSSKSAGASGASQWKPSRLNASRATRELPVPRADRDYVRQEITLEPLNEPVVFSIYPVFGLGGEDFVRYDGERSQLVRWPLRLHQTRLTVALGTSGVKNRRQSPLMPDMQPLYPAVKTELMQLPAPGANGDPLVQLKTVAMRVVEQAQVPENDHYLISQALEAHLRGSGDYLYSLQGAKRDPAIDPLEDFVTSNRSGHCEYFASALVMMLRSQGVPARLVIGYKGGEWNELGSYYQFRQLHAHTWVEAYLSREQLAKRKVDLAGAPGGWLRLDPTAYTSDDSADGVLASMGQVLDYVETLWMRNVVGLDYQQQERKIYGPFRDISSSLAGITSPQSWLGGARDMLERLKAWLGGRWLSPRSVLLLVVLAVLVYGAKRLLSKLSLGSLFRRRVRRQRAATPEVEFYRRFERALRKIGLVRQPAQTQREFAQALQVQAGSGQAKLAEAAALAEPVIEAFYRVRFGSRALDSQEQEQVEQALRRIEAAVRR